VRAYEMASNEQLPGIALPSLTIVAAGLLPLTLLARRIARRPARTLMRR